MTRRAARTPKRPVAESTPCGHLGDENPHGEVRESKTASGSYDLTMSRTQIVSVEVPRPSGAYSHAVKVGEFLFLSGQGPYDRTDALVGSTVGEQTRQALDNLESVARAGGGSLRSGAVRVGVYLSSLDDFEEMNATYEAFFDDFFPARTTIQSDLGDIYVEIDAVVWLGG
jgi:2-iminobutanoate/2-iminopropanoate deaminase